MTGDLILKAQMINVSLTSAQTKENAIQSKIKEIESTELVALNYKRTGIEGNGLINFNVKIGNVSIIDSVTKLSTIVNKVEGIVNVSILQYKFEEGR